MMKKILSKLTVALFAISLATPCLMANTVASAESTISTTIETNTINSRKIDISGSFYAAQQQEYTLKSFKVGALINEDHNAFTVKVSPTSSNPYYCIKITGSNGYSFTSNYHRSATTTTTINCKPDVTYTAYVYSPNDILTGNFSITSFID